MQQPKAGTTQQAWNREVEASLQAFRDAIEKDHNEMVEVGKLIQGELERGQDDVESLRGQINRLKSDMAEVRVDVKKANDEASHPTSTTLLGIGVTVAFGLLLVSLVRLWVGMRLVRMFELLNKGVKDAAGEDARAFEDKSPAIR